MQDVSLYDTGHFFMRCGTFLYTTRDISLYDAGYFFIWRLTFLYMTRDNSLYNAGRFFIRQGTFLYAMWDISLYDAGHFFIWCRTFLYTTRDISLYDSGHFFIWRRTFLYTAQDISLYLPFSQTMAIPSCLTLATLPSHTLLSTTAQSPLLSARLSRASAWCACAPWPSTLWRCANPQNYSFDLKSAKAILATFWLWISPSQHVNTVEEGNQGF